MLRRTVKATAYALSAVLLCTGLNIEAYAATGISSVLPSGGINIALDNGTTLENLQDQTSDKSIQLETVVNEEQVNEAKAAAAAEAAARELAKEEEMFKNLVLAQVSA